MTYWQEQAQVAQAAGYRPGNTWEKMLERHLGAYFPALLHELEWAGDLAAYLTVQTAGAMAYEDRLHQAGTPPDVAHELALEQLLTVPAAWDREGGGPVFVRGAPAEATGAEWVNAEYLQNPS